MSGRPSRKVFLQVAIPSVIPVVTFVFLFVKALLGREALFGDFRMFYAAADLAKDSRWPVVYDVVGFARNVGELFDTEVLLGGPTYGYPPLLAQLIRLLIPLAGPGILGAAFVVVPSLVGVWALRRLGASWGLVGVSLAWYPAALAFFLGQNAAISMAVVAVAVWLVRRDRSFAAGLVLGLLVYKPQLLVVLGLLLLLAWRDLKRVALGALSSGLGISVLSFIIEPEAWRAFPSGLLQLARSSGDRFRIGRVGATDFIYLLLDDTWLLTHVLAIILALAGCWWFRWVRRRADGDIDLVLAAAIVASLWINPWAFIYEWAVLPVVAVLLVGRGFIDRKTLVQTFFVIGSVALLTAYVTSSMLDQWGWAVQIATPVYAVTFHRLFKQIFDRLADEHADGAESGIRHS